MNFCIPPIGGFPRVRRTTSVHETLTKEIEQVGRTGAHCKRLMSDPGIGPMILTAMVAVNGSGEAFERRRSRCAEKRRRPSIPDGLSLNVCDATQ